MTVRHQNRRFILAAKCMQGTFRPHEWGIEKHRVEESVSSEPDNQILPLSRN